MTTPDFPAWGERINAALGIGLTAATVFVEGDAKKRAPVDTGKLRASITHNVEGAGDEWHGVVGTNTEYAAFQEFGTKRNPPQPFLLPAVNENKGTIVRLIANEIRKLL